MIKKLYHVDASHHKSCIRKNVRKNVRKTLISFFQSYDGLQVS